MKQTLLACVLAILSFPMWAQTPPPTERVPPPPPSERVTPPPPSERIPPPAERIPPPQTREVMPPPAQSLERDHMRQGAQQNLDRARLQCQTQPEAQRKTCLDQAQRDYDATTERMKRENDPQNRR